MGQSSTLCPCGILCLRGDDLLCQDRYNLMHGTESVCKANVIGRMLGVGGVCGVSFIGVRYADLRARQGFVSGVCLKLPYLAH